MPRLPEKPYMEEIMPEEWRDVVGFEGVYEVSSAGRLRNKKTQRFLSSNGRGGYVVDILCSNGKSKTARRHRIVAEAFIPNPEHKPEVNHKNGNKEDNSVENLEWATHRENTDHAWLTGLTKLPKPVEKSVVQLCEGKWLATYRSILIASKVSKTDASDILMCCKGRRLSAGGYEWKYREDFEC